MEKKSLRKAVFFRNGRFIIYSAEDLLFDLDAISGLNLEDEAKAKEVFRILDALKVDSIEWMEKHSEEWAVPTLMRIERGVPAWQDVLYNRILKWLREVDSE